MNLLLSLIVVLASALVSQPASASTCPAPTGLPAVRKGGNLIVESPPRPARAPGGMRLRSHTIGASPHISAPDLWTGPEVPMFVPLTSGSMQLDLLDPIDGGYLALYREPPGSKHCDNWKNCKFEVRLFDCAGNTSAKIGLNQFFSRPNQLEVQDVRYSDGVLYFNEACQTYSREAGGKCSSLIAVEIVAKRLLWRTAPLRSNDVFLLHGKYIIAGYGFTSEPSKLFVLRRSDGKVVASHALKVKVFPGGSHDALAIEPTGLLRVGIYEAWDDQLFRLEGFEGAKPKLVHVGKTAPPAHVPRRDTRPVPGYTPPPMFTLPPNLRVPKLPKLPLPRPKQP